MVRLFHGVMYHACAPDGKPQLHDASTPDHEPLYKWAMALTWRDPALPRSKLQLERDAVLCCSGSVAAVDLVAVSAQADVY